MVFIAFWPQIVLIFVDVTKASLSLIDVTKASVQLGLCKTDLVLPQTIKAAESAVTQ